MRAAKPAGRLFAAATALLAGAFVLLALAACQRAPVFVQEGFVFGTRIEISVAGADEAGARAAASAVLAEFDRLHRMLHAWQPSEVTALNAAIAAGQPHTVSPELAALLVDAQALTRAGDGLFDPGIGALVALWGFHADEFVPRLPAPEALQAWLAARPSLADLEIDGLTVRSRQRGVAVDFGGYAKGYALDRAAAILRARGVRHALVNIGGNVLALGDKHGKPWRVGIRDPRGGGHLAALDLFDGEAIGTSGDYQRYFEVDGRRYAHLLDPRSGQPATTTQAVSVLIPAGPQAGTRSDALSKPLFVAGGDAFSELAQRLGVTHALHIDAGGRLRVTEALAQRLSFADAKRSYERLP